MVILNIDYKSDSLLLDNITICSYLKNRHWTDCYRMAYPKNINYLSWGIFIKDNALFFLI